MPQQHLVYAATLSIVTEELALDQFRQLVDVAADVVLVTEAEPLDEPGPRIVYANQAFTDLTGYTLEEVQGRSPRFLQKKDETDPETLHSIRNSLNAFADFHGEVLNFSKTGEPYWLDIRIFPLKNAAGEVTHFAAIERDITERTEKEMALRKVAFEDPLTGLLNRRGYETLASRVWMRPEKTGGCVMILDVDKFKSINDTHGHVEGDQVLASLGRVILHRSREADVAVRLGGDEFCVILPGTSQPEAIARADSIRQDLRILSAESLIPETTLSIGIAASDDPDTSLEQLVKDADEALYLAKGSGGDQVSVHGDRSTMS